jgi:predicted amidohydrolase YtcJ
MKRGSGWFARRLAFAVCPVLAMFLSISHALAQSASPSKSDSDDVILINGKIITADGKDSIAQALAIHDGKIVAVGSNDEIKRRIAKHPRVIDLHGRTATPGLIDTHCHFDQAERIYGIELSKITRVSEAVALVRQKTSSSKPGEWVTGSGWDEGKLSELRYITAADLDKVSPDNPVWLGHTTGHYGVANSYALHLAKLSQETKDPKGGTIDRDAAGRPTGVLKEEAMGLVTSLIPPFSRDQQRIGVLKMMADFNSEGMTAAKDPGTEGTRWDLYQEILKEKNRPSGFLRCCTAGETWNPLAPFSRVFRRSQNRRSLLVTACFFPAGSNFTWTAAAAAALRGSTSRGSRSARKSKPEIPATQTSIRKFTGKW